MSVRYDPLQVKILGINIYLEITHMDTKDFLNVLMWHNVLSNICKAALLSAVRSSQVISAHIRL